MNQVMNAGTVVSAYKSLYKLGGVAACKYDPTKLRFPTSTLAGNTPASDIRDWTAIRAWAAGLKPILAV